jgi:DNA modification methylase
MEVDPKYVDVTIERFQKLTGEKAIHAGTNLTLEKMKVRRARQKPKAATNAAG